MNIDEKQFKNIIAEAEKNVNKAKADPIKILANAEKRLQKLYKTYKHTIDQKAAERYFFPVNARRGITEKLEKLYQHYLLLLRERLQPYVTTQDDLHSR